MTKNHSILTLTHMCPQSPHVGSDNTLISDYLCGTLELFQLNRAFSQP